MSTTDDAPAVVRVGRIADPAPLGLAAFALTTFLLSAINAGWAKTSSGFDWWGYAIAYGGLIQLLAGMWEFRNKNVFGATAFSSYGGFWIGLGLWLHFIVPGSLAHPVSINRDLGWILLAFLIFNTYMLIVSTQLNMAVFGVFLTLGLTETLPGHRELHHQRARSAARPDQLEVARDRRVPRHRDRSRGLVHVGRRRDERPQGQSHLPGRQAADEPLGTSQTREPGDAVFPGSRCPRAQALAGLE